MGIISIIVGSIALSLLIFISIYNRLSRRKNQIQNSISSLDALFIKRSDLIPNLVAIVKQYMTFEEGTLEKITALRTTTTNDNQVLEREGVNALKGMMIQVENYPELKANTQFTNLQYSWNEVEEQISAGRRYISASITDYNNYVTTFPGNIIASITGFSQYEWQYASKEQQQSIDANDLFST